ncbi:MAG TPA: lipopolysaccharide biosynthesis protein [Kofleriaceae bacterium]
MTDSTQPSGQPSGQLQGQVRRGISWNLVGAVSTNAMRVLVVVVLGRVLGSHDFGVVAAALSVIAILHMVRDLGIGPALIQRKELARGHVATAFAVSTYLGAGLAVVVFATAPLVGRLYHSPECVDLLRALAVIFVLRGLAATSQMTCQRAMNFRAVALIDTVSYSAGSIASMALAFAGLGPWSLVVGYLLEEATSTVAFLVLHPPPFTLRIDRARLADLLGFGTGQTLFQIVNVIATQGDNIVVGHALGPTALGYYSRAYDLIKLPGAVFTNVVGNVLFPAFSRLQDDPVRLGAGFRRIVFVNALVLLPASAVLIVIAPEAIRILMGPRWGDAVLPFQILALVMVMRVSYKVGVVVASAAGAVYALATVNVLYAICVIGGAALTIPWGIPGVAASTAGSIAVMYLLCAWLGMQRSALTWRGFAAAHVPGLVLGAAIGAGAWPVAAALRGAGLPAAATLAIIAVLGAGGTCAAAWLWMRRGGGDFAWLRSELAGAQQKLRRGRAPVVTRGELGQP